MNRPDFGRMGRFLADRPRLAAAIPILIFACVSYILKTYGVRQHFGFFGDQAMAWEYVNRPFLDIPLLGATTTDGGYSSGPILYWWLWLIRTLIGPFCDFMPVASGLAMAFMNASSEALVLWSLARRGLAWPVLASLGLLFLSSVTLNTVCAEPWSPALSLAFCGYASAAVLGASPSVRPGRAALAAGLAVLAFQAHPAAIVLAAPLVFFLVVSAWLDGGAKSCLRVLAVIIITALALHAPYVSQRLLHPELFTATTKSTQSLAMALSDPSLIAPAKGFSFVYEEMAGFMQPWLPRILATGLIAAASLLTVALYRCLRPQIYVSALPLFGAACGFSLYQVKTLSWYWLVPLASAFNLTLVFGLAAPLWNRPGRFPKALLLAGLAGLACVQPAVWEERAKNGYVHYGVMEQAALSMARHGISVRAFFPPDPDAYGADLRNFNLLAHWAGVRLDPEAPFYVQVDAKGNLIYRDGPLDPEQMGLPRPSAPKPPEKNPTLRLFREAAEAANTRASRPGTAGGAADGLADAASQFYQKELAIVRLADLDQLRRALERYRQDHGEYPPCPELRGVITGQGALRPDWIPGLVPDYLPVLPRDPRLSGNPVEQYLYASNGADYKLISHHPDDGGLVARNWPNRLDPLRGQAAFGYWTAGAERW